LLCAAIRLGAMSANAIPSRLQSLSEFGMALGLAFQVIDDILDVTQSSETLGKSAGKDLVPKKATYPSVIGLEESVNGEEADGRSAPIAENVRRESDDPPRAR